MTVPQGLLDVGHEAPEGAGQQQEQRRLQQGGGRYPPEAGMDSMVEQENSTAEKEYGGNQTAAEGAVVAGDQEHQAVSLAREEREARDKKARGEAAKKKVVLPPQCFATYFPEDGEADFGPCCQ
jgi:hypothetical protein